MIGEHTPTIQESDDILPGRLDQHLIADAPVCVPGDDVATIWASLRGHPFRTVDDIAVCETATDGSRRPVGLIPIEKLCAAVDTQKAAELMDPDPGVVVGDVAYERATWKAGPPRLIKSRSGGSRWPVPRVDPTAPTLAGSASRT